VDDVVQATWHDLVRDIHRLREPAAIPGWLATTARRNAMRRLQVRAREVLSDDPALGDCVESDAGPYDALLAAERREALTAALTTLPARHRQLMTVLACQRRSDARAVPGAPRARRTAAGARGGRVRRVAVRKPTLRSVAVFPGGLPAPDSHERSTRSPVGSSAQTHRSPRRNSTKGESSCPEASSRAAASSPWRSA
jgi:hypothetical protein